MKRSHLAKLCLALALIGSQTAALAQSGRIPQAPIGHRQPSAADVPADDSIEGFEGFRTPKVQSFGPALRSLPKLDIKAICRRARPLLADDKGAYQSCLDDEVEAQKELSHKWFAFKPAARAMCTEETQIGGAPSFVELITCLELDRQAAQARIENAKPFGSPVTSRIKGRRAAARS